MNVLYDRLLYYTVAPNDQFVEKCIIKPKLMKICVIKAFSGVFQYCWEKNYLFLFPSKSHKKFPSQEDKIGWFPSQLQSEQPASRRTTLFYIVRQNWRSQRPQLHPSVGGGGGGGGNGENHRPFKSLPLSSNKFPSQLIETTTILPANKIPLGNR